MPYNPGTGIYTLPAIYLAVPGTTIIAAQHNTPLEDLEVANNYARPIVAGGTGSISAVTARGSTTGIATEGNIGAKGANIASAATLTLVDNFNYNHVTGVVTVTAISTRTAGQRILLEFEGALLLTHSAALFLQPPVNRTTAAGDVAEFVSEGAGNWRMVSYGRAAGAAPTNVLISATGNWTRPLNCIRAEFKPTGGGGAGGNVGAAGAGTGGVGGGGGSGFSGSTGIIDVTSVVTTVAITIGAAGAVNGAAGGDGGSGGATTFTVNAVAYSAGGGSGGGGMNAGGTIGGSQDGGPGGTGTNLLWGGSNLGGIGVYNANSATNATSGAGASSPFGTGGRYRHLTSAATAPGLVGTGFGVGGSGGCTVNSGAALGAAGTAGCCLVTEYYD